MHGVNDQLILIDHPNASRNRQSMLPDNEDVAPANIKEGNMHVPFHPLLMNAAARQRRCSFSSQVALGHRHVPSAGQDVFGGMSCERNWHAFIQKHPDQQLQMRHKHLQKLTQPDS